MPSQPRVCILATIRKEWNIFKNNIPYFKREFSNLTVVTPIGNMTEHEKIVKDFHPNVFLISQTSKRNLSLCALFSDAKVIYVQHGASCIKEYIKVSYWNYRDMRHFLANDMLVRLFQTRTNRATNFQVSGGYLRSREHIEGTHMRREDFFRIYSLDPRKPLALYARTWIHNKEGKGGDAEECMRELDRVTACNVISIPHSHGKKLSSERVKDIQNDGDNIIEALKHADIVISDTSSLIFEAAAHQKRIIQILCMEYSDNKSENFQLPNIPIIDQPFYAGWLTKPKSLKKTVEFIANNPNIYDEEFSSTINNIGKLSGVKREGTLDRLFHMIRDDAPLKESQTTPMDVEEYQHILGYPQVFRHKSPGDKIVLCFIDDDTPTKKFLKDVSELGTILIIGSKKPLKRGHHNFIITDEELFRHYIHKYQADVVVSKGYKVPQDLCPVIEM